MDRRARFVGIADYEAAGGIVLREPSEIARAGVFVSIGTDGGLHVERGYVRPEDEEPVTADESEDGRRAARCRGGVASHHAAPPEPCNVLKE